MSKPSLKIEIVSDVVCPWCYIGKRRLEKAIHELDDEFDFSLSWLPFELNPDMEPGGRPQKEYLMEKFGSEQRYQQLTGNVAAIAAQEGLTFNYPKQKVSPNTRDSHRLIQLAGHEGKQAAVKEALMKAYFTDGIDLSKDENLINVAAAAGLNAQKVRSLLKSDDGVAEVIVAEQNSIQRGVSGVPFYIVNEKYGISGAQPADVFVKTLREISAAERSVES